MNETKQESQNRLLIPVSQEDHSYVESLCINGAYTFETLFKHMLRLYKNSLNQPLECNNTRESVETKKRKANTTK